MTGHRSPLVDGGTVLSGLLPCLTKIGYTITPTLKLGVMGRRLFLIVGLMKGHVGGGPGSGGFKAPGAR